LIKRVGLAILPALIVLGLTGPIAGAEDQGYIVLEKARYYHQQGSELERLERKYSDYEKTLNNLLEKEQFVEAMAEKHYQQVEQQLEEARKRIARDYEEKITRFKQEIEEGLAAAKEEVQEQAQQELVDFEGELQERYQEEMAGRLEEYNQKYRNYRAEIREEYSFEIFNLRLQLDLARLSESERARKEEEMEELEQEKKEALREKEEEIAWGVKTFSLRLQLELGEKIADFVELQEQQVRKS